MSNPQQKRILVEDKQVIFGAETITQSSQEASHPITFTWPFETDDVMVLAGLNDPGPGQPTPTTGVGASQVTRTGFSALFKTDSPLPSPQNMTLSWIAIGRYVQITNQQTIIVSWPQGGSSLVVDPSELWVTEPTKIRWRTAAGEAFNIVGVFGLTGPDFELQGASKPSEGSTLEWSCLARCGETRAYHYSILAERNGEVRFHDPKITNQPELKLP